MNLVNFVDSCKIMDPGRHNYFRNILLFSVGFSVIGGTSATIIIKLFDSDISAASSFGLISQHCLITSMIFFGKREFLLHVFHGIECDRAKEYSASVFAGYSTAACLSKLILRSRAPALKRHAVVGFGVGMLGEMCIDFYYKAKHTARETRILRLKRDL